MIVNISINAQIDKDAFWIPTDGKSGIETDLKELVSSVVMDNLDGIVINDIRVLINDNI
tara:strand:+ start:1550 stop:1726 length:177 start_codon:yes stop_codon:yes gene_type:complete